MDHQKIKQLLHKYLEAETTANEEQKLRAYFQNENVPEELQPYADQFRYNEEMKKMGAGVEFDPLDKINFEEEASVYPFEGAQNTAKVKSRGMAESINNSATRWFLRVAAGFALLVIGFATGQFLTNNDDYASNQQVAKLHEEVQQMKNALMNTDSYKTASAGERLSAVNVSTRIPLNDEGIDQQITDVLIHAMNNDKSVNVRIAAAEALFRFRQEEGIKPALVNGLSEQNNPLMQITLIDMLVELKATDAVSEMEKLLVDSDTQDIVRQRLQASIAELKI